MTARRRLAVALLVPFGVVVSHLIAYAAARPRGAPSADAVTAAHGHLGPLAMVAALGVAAAVALSGFAGATGRHLRLTPRSIAVAQAVGFVAMELGEHLSHGATLPAALTEPSLWVGLAVQVAVAAVSCLLLRFGEAVGRRLGRPRAASWPKRVAVAPAAHSPLVRPVVALSSLSRRGPPLLASGR